MRSACRILVSLNGTKYLRATVVNGRNIDELNLWEGARIQLAQNRGHSRAPVIRVTNLLA
jgi:hypothetical protein